MFLVVGEAVLDVVAGGVEPPSSHVGGSPLNVAVGLARLGLPVTLVTRYGTDPAGDQVHARLQAEGIAEVVPRDQLPTSAAHGVLDPAGAADYDFDQVEWDLAGFAGETAHEAVEAAHVVHAGSLASVLEPGAETVLRIVETARPTVRELLGLLAAGGGHATVIGTPEQVADEIERWVDAGAADGFNLMPPTLPGGIEEFVDQVVPVLQRRGRFRREYEGTTLRDHLGLPRPRQGMPATAGS